MQDCYPQLKTVGHQKSILSE